MNTVDYMNVGTNIMDYISYIDWFIITNLAYQVTTGLPWLHTNIGCTVFSTLLLFRRCSLKHPLACNNDLGQQIEQTAHWEPHIN